MDDTSTRISSFSFPNAHNSLSTYFTLTTPGKGALVLLLRLADDEILVAVSEAVEVLDGGRFEYHSPKFVAADVELLQGLRNVVDRDGRKGVVAEDEPPERLRQLRQVKMA